MFYADVLSPEIRQGDIFEGLINIGIISTKFLTPAILNKEHIPCFSVNLGFSYAVVITPCCDIQKREYLAFCPLFPLTDKIRKNRFFAELPTRLNAKIEPQNAVPSEVWEAFPEEDKAKRLAGGKGYHYKHNFVFEKYDDIFTDYMLIDFNFVFNVSRKTLGGKNQLLVPNRILQLSIESRRDLRLKLADYYFRDPDTCTLNK